MRLWYAATETWKQTFEGHSDCVNAAAFSPDDKVLASTSNHKTVRLRYATIGAWNRYSRATAKKYMP